MRLKRCNSACSGLFLRCVSPSGGRHSEAGCATCCCACTPRQFFGTGPAPAAMPDLLHRASVAAAEPIPESPLHDSTPAARRMAAGVEFVFRRRSGAFASRNVRPAAPFSGADSGGAVSAEAARLQRIVYSFRLKYAVSVRCCPSISRLSLTNTISEAFSLSILQDSEKSLIE